MAPRTYPLTPPPSIPAQQAPSLGFTLRKPQKRRLRGWTPQRRNNSQWIKVGGCWKSFSLSLCICLFISCLSLSICRSVPLYLFLSISLLFSLCFFCRSLSVPLSLFLYPLFYSAELYLGGEESGAVVVVDEAHKEARVEAVESVKRELTPAEFHQYCKKVGILT